MLAPTQTPWYGVAFSILGLRAPFLLQLFAWKPRVYSCNSFGSLLPMLLLYFAAEEGAVADDRGHCRSGRPVHILCVRHRGRHLSPSAPLSRFAAHR